MECVSGVFTHAYSQRRLTSEPNRNGLLETVACHRNHFQNRKRSRLRDQNTTIFLQKLRGVLTVLPDGEGGGGVVADGDLQHPNETMTSSIAIYPK